MKTFQGSPGVNHAVGAKSLPGPVDVAHVLLSGSSQAITPPAGAKYAVFSVEKAAIPSNYAVQWKDSTVAVYPLATAASGELAELNPDIRYVGDRFHSSFVSPDFTIIADVAGMLTISFYA
jgi:hypothetical protein